MSNPSASGRRATVVVIGGGYGGSGAAKALDTFADVTLVEPRDAFVHNVAALRALVDPEWLPQIFFPYDPLLANGRVVRDRAVAVEPGRVELLSGEVLTPDYVVIASGSTYPYPAKSGTVETSAALRRYAASHEELAQRRPRADRGCRADRPRARRRDQRPLAREADHDRRARARRPRRALPPGSSRRGAPPAQERGVEIVLGEVARCRSPKARPPSTARSPSRRTQAARSRPTSGSAAMASPRSRGYLARRARRRPASRRLDRGDAGAARQGADGRVRTR